MRAGAFSRDPFWDDGRGSPTHAVDAVEHLRRMRGGSQSHLMRCSDGKLYVVKFLNNPQHVRVLANEIVGTSLADLIGLPVPRMAFVHVEQRLIQETPALTVSHVDKTIVPCSAGIQFGSEYVINPFEGRIFDVLPMEHLDRVRNLADFAGVLAFDKWTGNVDDRQAMFWRKGRQKKYTVTFIDQGHCFNLGRWDFPDKPFQGGYLRSEVYSGVRDWQSFEPWLSRIEAMNDFTVQECAPWIPPEWSIEANELSCLLRNLADRRSIVRNLIDAFRISGSNPFPNWEGPRG